MSSSRPSVSETVFALTVTLVSAVLFLCLAAAAASGFTHIGLLVLLGIFAFIWLALTPLYLATARVSWLSIAFALVSAAALVIFGRFHLGAMIGALILLLTLYPAQRALKSNLYNRIQYHTGQAFGAGVRILILGLVMSAAGLVLPHISSLIEQRGISVSSETVNWIVKPLAPYLSNELPGLAEGGTVDDFIDSQVSGQLPEGQALAPEQRQLFYAEISQKFNNQPITGSETLADIVAFRINSWLDKLIQANSITISLALIILVLLTIRAVFPLVAWIVLGLIAAAVWLGRLSGLFQLTETTTPVQKLELNP